jgi:hypothetical protein
MFVSARLFVSQILLGGIKLEVKRLFGPVPASTAGAVRAHAELHFLSPLEGIVLQAGRRAVEL